MDTKSEHLKIYDERFFLNQSDKSRRSANQIVPFLAEVANPKSVLDIGCGTGSWCAEFAHSGVEIVSGVDGPWVNLQQLAIEPCSFFPYDFITNRPPFDPKLPRRRYDMATTFEFLEHVPAEQANGLIEFLVSASDIIIAGAAIPGQGGRHHVNEQWPSYWAAKFAQQGYECFDIVRPLFWDNPLVLPWYSQNTIVYARGEKRSLFSTLNAFPLDNANLPLSLVHPNILDMTLKPKGLRRQSVGLMLSAINRIARNRP